jgi:hypothetical protein
MYASVRFVKWGLGLFTFGVFASFGIIAHYCVGARWPTGELFMQNITLWWACPWTLAVASVQIGGLGMVAIGLTRIVLARVSPQRDGVSDDLAFWLCAIGLIGVFLVGYPGYFAFDAVWPAFFYSSTAVGKNTWLLSQAFFVAVYFAGVVLAFGEIRGALDTIPVGFGSNTSRRIA